MSARKRVFVTGGTGFLGLNLIDELLHRKTYDILCLHRASSDLTELKKRPITLVEGSLFDVTQLTQLIPLQCDVVFHCAANTNMWKKRNEEQTRDNVLGTRNLVESSLTQGVKRFVHTSSIAAFGHHNGRIDETTPSNARDSKVNYVLTKFLAEQEVKKGIDRGLNAVFINPSNIVGPYDQHNWATMIKLTVSNRLPAIPSGYGSFCHVREVAKALITASEKGDMGEHYLLGGSEASYLDFVNTVTQIMGKPIHVKVLPPLLLKLYAHITSLFSLFTQKAPQVTPEIAELTSAHMSCDSQKAKQVLGYQEVPLLDMVRDYLDWMKANRVIPQ